jgi:hypothetical protein
MMWDGENAIQMIAYWTVIVLLAIILVRWLSAAICRNRGAARAKSWKNATYAVSSAARSSSG